MRTVSESLKYDMNQSPPLLTSSLYEWTYANVMIVFVYFFIYIQGIPGKASVSWVGSSAYDCIW